MNRTFILKSIEIKTEDYGNDNEASNLNRYSTDYVRQISRLNESGRGTGTNGQTLHGGAGDCAASGEYFVLPVKPKYGERTAEGDRPGLEGSGEGSIIIC